MAFCKNPLIEIYDHCKDLIKEYNYKRFVSWKWWKRKRNIDKYIRNDKIAVYPCGSCLNCVNMKRYHWVKKLSLEKLNWQFCYFITLTYNDENLPMELQVKDVQKFIKYLRKFIKDFKYFCCGEYGSKYGRPHYHLILFCNYELNLQFLKYTKTGPLYDCDLLNKCWLRKGYIWVAHDFNNMSFAYVSSYSNKIFLKKIQNIKLKEFNKNVNAIINNPLIDGFKKYLFIDQLIPDIIFKKSEFIIMSKKPPIGANSENVNLMPSSLLKWKEKEFYKNTIASNPYCDELEKRKKDYFIFLEKNNIYDIIKTDEILYNKNHQKKKGIF